MQITATLADCQFLAEKYGVLYTEEYLQFAFVGCSLEDAEDAMSYETRHPAYRSENFTIATV